VNNVPDLGPLGRGGARRRTRRRMNTMNEMNQEESSGDLEAPNSSDKLLKLARLLKDKGVISEEEFNLLFD
jgi:hypothetical protein